MATRKVQECPECVAAGDSHLATTPEGTCEKHKAIAPQAVEVDEFAALDPDDGQAYAAFMARNGGRDTDKTFVPGADPTRDYFHSNPEKVFDRKQRGWRVETTLKSRCRGQVLMSIPKAWRAQQIKDKGRIAEERMHSDTEAALEAKIASASAVSGTAAHMNIPGRKAELRVTRS